MELYRYTIIKEKKKYFVGKNIFGKKAYVEKNKETNRYKVGTNDSFYATKKIKGIIFKRIILTPVDYNSIV